MGEKLRYARDPNNEKLQGLQSLLFIFKKSLHTGCKFTLVVLGNVTHVVWSVGD